MSFVLGEIRFKDSDSVIRKYAILDFDTDVVQKLKDILTNSWELADPKILFSIFGSKEDFQMSESLKNAFGRGLVKAARSTGAWILTQGIDRGVSKYVGEAIRDHRLSSVSISSNPIVTIGIANYIDLHHGTSPSYSTGSMLINSLLYSRVNVLDKEIDFLDPNHTHFVLVDNCPMESFDISRYKIQRTISTIGRMDFSPELQKVPIVYIIVCGDMDTLSEIQQATMDGIPILVISGSGNLADVLAFACRVVISRDGETYAIEDEAFQEIVRRLTDVPNINSHCVMSDAKIIVDVVTSCFQLFTVYDLHLDDNKMSDIDVSILRALLKANVHSLAGNDYLVYQLYCALAFDNCEVARNEIFTEDRKYSRLCLDIVAHHAILEDKADFMELLLDKGHDARQFVTQNRLCYFYSQTHQQLFQRLLHKVKADATHVTLKHIGHLIKYLMGDFYHPSYLDEKPLLNMKQNKGFETLRLENLREKDNIGVPFKHLYLWGILTGRMEMARLFWKHGKDKIAAALVAYGLLSSLSHETGDQEQKRNLLFYAKSYNDLAVAVLNECSKSNEQNAQQLLSQNVSSWGDISCLELAVGTCNKHFIAQMTCQSILKAKWMGGLSTENSTLRIMTCVTVPPAILLLIKYNTLKTATETESIEENQVTPLQVKLEEERKPDIRGKSKRKITRVPLCNKCYNFYTAPVIVFVHNVLSYILFLTLYSYVLLVDLRKEISPLDIVLFIWVGTLCLEEVRQVVSTHSISLVSKLRRYIKDIWNILDVITILLFACGTTVRFLPYANTLDAARVILGINLITFFIRALHVFSVHRKMGPKIIMIGRMFQDLLYFLVILLLFLTSYAIAAYSILFPNSALNGNLIMNIFKTAYWNLFGELILEDIDKKSLGCTNDPALYHNNTLPRCPAELGVYAGPILTGVYVLFSNTLLLNLVIAMFSFTFQKIHYNTDLHWHYQRSVLIYEYCSRPPLPPPFIVISHIILAFQWLVGKCSCRRKTESVPDRDGNDSCYQKLRRWENSIAHSYLQRLEATENESVSNRVSQIYERTERMSNQMDFILERLLDHGYLLQRLLTLSDNKTSSDHVIPRLCHHSDQSSHARSPYPRKEHSTQKILRKLSAREQFVADGQKPQKKRRMQILENERSVAYLKVEHNGNVDTENIIKSTTDRILKEIDNARKDLVQLGSNLQTYVTQSNASPPVEQTNGSGYRV